MAGGLAPALGVGAVGRRRGGEVGALILKVVALGGVQGERDAAVPWHRRRVRAVADLKGDVARERPADAVALVVQAEVAPARNSACLDFILSLSWSLRGRFIGAARLPEPRNRRRLGWRRDCLGLLRVPGNSKLIWPRRRWRIPANVATLIYECVNCSGAKTVAGDSQFRHLRGWPGRCANSSSITAWLEHSADAATRSLAN